MALGDDINETTQEQRVLSVGQLTAQIKETLESSFPAVWVSGEISNLARPQSGHVYLTLKDENAQIRAVMWRGTAARLHFDLEDGQQVVCQGDIDVYPPRGSYQLVIRQIQPQGLGALQLAFRKLHARLAAEGLFAEEIKKPLPDFPRRIAFVTSPTGAAIRDFLQVAHRRWQGVQILVVPVRVQGEEAAGEIVQAIATVNQIKPRVDVLVVGRGGGSLEDLWCFNDESVVRAIYESAIPVVSAVGHEIDVTLSDLVADLRAATPTEAAERVVPSADAIRVELENIRQRLSAVLRQQALQARVQLDAIASQRAFRRPVDHVHELARRLDELDGRASRAMRNCLQRNQDFITALSGRLDTLSPLAVLGRGYSVTQRTADALLLRDTRSLLVGQQITTRLAQGQILSRIEKLDR